MTYLYSLKKISDTDYIVEGIHNMPLDPVNGLGKTKTELEKEGVFIDTLPAPDAPKKGIDNRLHVNPKTKEVWYEQFEVPLSNDDEISQLKKQQALMQSAIDDMLMTGGVL